MHDDANLRERTRRAVRTEIVEAAMKLFLDQGFEATTVEEIARAAGISRRSYFRYFTTKDDALTDGLAAIGREIATALQQRPEEEAPWTALRRALDPLLEHDMTAPHTQALGRLMLERPALRQRKDAAWQTEIASVLADRMTTAEPDARLRAQALTAAAIACLDAAQVQWLDADQHVPLCDLLDTAMDAVHQLD